MTPVRREWLEQALRTFEAKDLDGFLNYFAEDALFYDPHYPAPAMQGKDAIRQGLLFATGMIEQPGFSIRNFWSGEGSCAAEVDTHHTFAGGNESRFAQVFIIIVQDNLLTRFQSYTPYPPPAPPQ